MFRQAVTPAPRSDRDIAERMLREEGGERVRLPSRFDGSRRHVALAHPPLTGDIWRFGTERGEVLALSALRGRFTPQMPFPFKPLDRQFFQIEPVVTGPLFHERGRMLDIEPTHEGITGGTVWVVGGIQSNLTYEIFLPATERGAPPIQQLAAFCNEHLGLDLRYRYLRAL